MHWEALVSESESTFRARFEFVNRIRFIENQLFEGLVELNTLNLLNNSDELTFENKSVNTILNISNIYLDFRVVVVHKCMFMLSIERLIRRNISNRFIFYKSINLMTSQSELDVMEFVFMCELAFELIQFKIHLNLKSDKDFDQFIGNCSNGLINELNVYEQSLSTCKFKRIKVKWRGLAEISQINENRLLNVFSNYLYLLTMGTFLLLLCPVFYFLCLQFRSFWIL